MNDLKIYKDILTKSIGRKRLNHSLNVVDTAVELAKSYNVSVHKTQIAAVLHDCGRLENNKILKEELKKYGLILDADSFNNYNLIHAILGRYIAYEVYGVTDFDILNSIRYHTTGRINMSILEKIIYLSDAIEPLRKYEDVDYIRKISKSDINQALILSLESTLKYLNNFNMTIHLNTINCLNWLKNSK